MAKKHIISFNGYDFACDSVTAATQAVALLSKLQPVRHVTDGGYDNWHYAPDEREFKRLDVGLKLNQPFREPRKPKPETTLALPAPKRGSILCICEKSYVAPRQSCPHCGRHFDESHNRTHQDKDTSPNLRLI